MTDLADLFDRELAAMPKNATRRYVAERLANLAQTEHSPSETERPERLERLVHDNRTRTLHDSELIAAEFHRKYDTI